MMKYSVTLGTCCRSLSQYSLSPTRHQPHPMTPTLTSLVNAIEIDGILISPSDQVNILYKNGCDTAGSQIVLNFKSVKDPSNHLFQDSVAHFISSKVLLFYGKMLHQTLPLVLVQYFFSEPQKMMNTLNFLVLVQ